VVMGPAQVFVEPPPLAEDALSGQRRTT